MGGGGGGGGGDALAAAQQQHEYPAGCGSFFFLDLIPIT